jgi:hypothetical protein
MKAQPLPKKIFDRAKELGVKKFTLNFSGGSDEGYLDISYDTDDSHAYNEELNEEILEWAWSVYDYSGAGDGNSYGDDIVYDLVAGKLTTSEWVMKRQDGEEEDEDLEVK